MEYTLDATNKKLGRIASEAALILRGKNTAHFSPNVLADVKVIITNASKVDMTPAKLNEKYARYSGYPGGLRFEKRERTIEKKGYAEVFEKAVRGMLPNNRLRARMLKNLIITE